MLKNYEPTNQDTILIILKFAICLLALFLIGNYMPKIWDEMDLSRSVNNDSTIRVVANSNTYKDQQIKQQIVQELQQYHYIDIENKVIIQQIYDLLTEKYPHLEITMKIGDNFLPPVRFSHTFYPQRTGTGLLIVLGNGRGDNWFCSVFPMVCGKDDRDEITFSWWEWLKENWL